MWSERLVREGGGGRAGGRVGGGFKAGIGRLRYRESIEAGKQEEFAWSEEEGEPLELLRA